MKSLKINLVNISNLIKEKKQSYRTLLKKVKVDPPRKYSTLNPDN